MLNKFYSFFFCASLMIITLSLIQMDEAHSEVQAQTLADQKVEMALEFGQYNKDHDSKSYDQNFGGLLHPELMIRRGEDLRANFRFLYRFDTHDKDRELFNIEDLWIEKSFQETQKTYSYIRLGYQIFNLSVMEFFHPTDVLNSLNYDTPQNRREKLGELSLLYSHKLPLGILEFYLLPLDRKNKYPSASSRLGLKREVISNDWHGRDIQWGLAFKTMLASADFNLYFIHQRDRKSSLMEYKASQNVLVAHHFPLWHLGATYQQDLGNKILLKGEAAIRHFEDNSKYYSTVWGPRRRNSYQTLALGAEKSYDYGFGGETKFFTEYQRYFGLNRDLRAEVDIFQNDLALGALHAFNDSEGQELKASLIADLERASEYLVDFNYSRRILEVWKASLGLRSILAHKHERSPNEKGLNPYAGDQFIEAKLSRFF